ncbi:hypothetical protein T265_05039 [Opisthorchis viverrini]|uniref:Uncharacterized protein n=1 Tax=Opisthorchis viverrini TaxID=6198 RepID=A0A074ZL31_OPIVI|nr:hypothetical protein T265_05039 [Opisthorchis viverrini]KER28063.1 hypothetical protein T265_05039 [Opisthorchis viverrini]
METGQHRQQNQVVGLGRPTSLLTAPPAYQHRQTHSFGTGITDGPWRRGEVICAGKVDHNLVDHGNFRLLSHNGIRRPGRGRNSWWSRGRRRPNYSSHYAGSPVYPPAGAGQPRGQIVYRNALRRTWNASMPQCLQHCGLAGQTGSTDDGFIDDTLLTDINQFSLHESSSDYFEIYDQSESVAVIQKRHLTSTASSDALDEADQQDQIKHPLGKSENCVSKLDESLVKGGSSGLGERPEDGYDEQQESRQDLKPAALGVPSLHGARTPTDYMTLVWDSNLTDDTDPSLDLKSDDLAGSD